MPVTGWKLEEIERAELLRRFVPAWPDVIADHITLDGHASACTPLPEATAAQIVGVVDDGEGLQALVVSMDGTTDRPDGSTYHITWSLDSMRGREAIESNTVIAQRGWCPLNEPIAIRIIPASW